MSDADISQAMRPHGLTGKLFAAVMERMNEKAYRWTVKQLAPMNPATLYELGFGTGRFLELAAARLPLKQTYGVDPSTLMLDQAKRRLNKSKVAFDLREGDDKSNFWPQQKFDAIVTLHAFQFWTDPAATLRRLHDQLTPNGTLAIVLRRHDKRRSGQALPNPISRSTDEIGGAKSALAAAGFNLKFEETLDDASYGLVSART